MSYTKLMTLNYEDALKSVLSRTRRLTPEKIFIEDAIGWLLAEDIYSKIDMPPFNKSAMDGYAVIAQDTQGGPAKLKCIGLIQAGGNFKKKILHGECVKIMTGAPLPKGSDSVIMIEDVTSSGKYVEIKNPVKKWENVCFKGEDIHKGKKVLRKGTIITSSCIALLAAVGRRRVNVLKRPDVTILNTGGEIVPLGRKLSRGQIYNSNGPQLTALLKSDGINSHYLGIAQDKPAELMQAVKKGLKGDMFLISGGVSMGDYDLVPSILKRAGVREIFHKVNIKPGKPLFFGRTAKTLVFGIPGNPVSNFLAYQLFILPAVYNMSGFRLCRPRFENGILESSFRQKTGRTHFVLTAAKKKGSCWRVKPVLCHGSADVLALSKANGFMVVDKDTSYIKAKSEVKIFLWRQGLIT